jgi:hypothetical protein
MRSNNSISLNPNAEPAASYQHEADALRTTPDAFFAQPSTDYRHVF